MKLQRVSLTNFLSFGESQEIALSGLVNIVGPNNSGKTNIFRAIEFARVVLGPNLNTSKYYHNQDPSHPYRVELDIEFDQGEREALCDLITCSTLMHQVRNLGSFPQGTATPNAEALKEILLYKYARRILLPLFTGKSTLIIMGSESEYYPPIIAIRFGTSKGTLYLQQFGLLTDSSTQPNGYGLVELGEILTNSAIRKSKKVAKYVQAKSGLPPLPSALERSNIFDFFDGRKGSQAIGMLIEAWQVTQIGSNRRSVPPLDQLRNFYRRRGFRFDAQTRLGLQDLFAQIFEDSTAIVSEPWNDVSTNIMEEAEEAEPSGRLSVNELPIYLFNLHNSERLADKRRYKAIESTFAKLTGGLEFEVSLRSIERKKMESKFGLARIEVRGPDYIVQAAPSQFDQMGIRTEDTSYTVHQAVLEISDRTYSAPLDFAAGGIAESLLVSAAVGGMEDKVILLDEPGQRMHPHLQRNLVELIQASITEHRNQIAIITHSPYLVGASDIDKTWRVTKPKGETTCINIGKTIKATMDKESKKITRYLGQADVRSLLFAKGVILVEGPVDRLAVEKIDEFMTGKGNGADLAGKEWSVIEVGGKLSFATFARLCDSMSLPYLIVADRDALVQADSQIEEHPEYSPTSAVIAAIHNKLSDEERTEINSLPKSLLPGKSGKWFPLDKFERLNQMVSNHGVFVFAQESDEALNSKTGGKVSPLKAIDLVSKQIQTETITDDFARMAKFLSANVS